MFRHSTKRYVFSVQARSFSRSLWRALRRQTNTSLGAGALVSNTTGSANTASGVNALISNSTGNFDKVIAK